MTRLVVALPAARQLLGQVNDIPAKLSHELLQSTPDRPPDVLLEFDPLALNFASANAGVVAAPNMSVNRISRTLGPKIDQLPTDPASCSAPAPNCSESSRSAQSSGGDRSAYHHLVAGSQSGATMHWKETLANRVGPFQPGAGCAVELTVKSSLPDGGGPPKVTTDGTVNAFQLDHSQSRRPPKRVGHPDVFPTEVSCRNRELAHHHIRDHLRRAWRKPELRQETQQVSARCRKQRTEDRHDGHRNPGRLRTSRYPPLGMGVSPCRT